MGTNLNLPFCEMTFDEKRQNQKVIKSLNVLTESERIDRLWSMDDILLWDLWRLDYKDALTVLFKKYHRQIVIRIYKRCHEKMNVSLAEIQDAFSEFMEKVLNGKYKDEPIRKNFEAFSIYYILYLVRTKAHKKKTNPTVSFGKNGHGDRILQHHMSFEKKIDFGSVLDCIPLISNKLYRNLVYLILIMGYNAKDLIVVFGKRERAYDKKYRAMEAFKKVLKQEGLWEELK